MIWPWSRFRQYEQQLDRERTSLKEYSLTSAHAVEVAAINLRTAERDLERAQTEAHALKQDLRHLSASLAARNDRKFGPIGDLNRDPFQEDPKIPSEWLTDDSELPALEAEELLDAPPAPES